MRLLPRTPTVVDGFGYTLTLDQVCRVLSMSRSTAKRLLDAGTFPVPALPRKFHTKYRFAAAQVDRYLSRVDESARRPA